MKIFKRSIHDKLSTITYKNILTLIVITLLLVTCIVYIAPMSKALYFVFAIFIPFIIGGVIAFVINIPMKFLETKVLKKNFKGKRALTMTLSFLFVFALITLVMILFVPQLVDSIISLKEAVPSFIDMLIKKMNEYEFLKPYSEKIVQMKTNTDYSAMFNQAFEFLKNGNFNPINNVVSAFTGILSIITNALIAIVFSFYLLVSKEEIQKGSTKVIYSYLNESFADKVYYFCHLLYKNFKNFIQGQVIDVTILGIITFIGMLILRIPYAAMVSVLIAFLALIPVVGSFIGCTIGFLFILIDNPTKAVWFIILFILVQQIDNNLIYPKIVGDKVGLPAIFTLVAIVVGAALGGIVGMWVAIPLFSAIYTVNKQYMKHKLKEKDIDIEYKPNYDFIDTDKEN